MGSFFGAEMVGFSSGLAQKMGSFGVLPVEQILRGVRGAWGVACEWSVVA